MTAEPDFGRRRDRWKALAIFLVSFLFYVCRHGASVSAVDPVRQLDAVDLETFRRCRRRGGVHLVDMIDDGGSPLGRLSPQPPQRLFESALGLLRRFFDLEFLEDRLDAGVATEPGDFGERLLRERAQHLSSVRERVCLLVHVRHGVRFRSWRRRSLTEDVCEF